jgi:hypothetical protein
MIYSIKANDGDGHTDEATVGILAEVPTPTPTPGFEAVFAHFFFLEKRKPVLKEKLWKYF